MHSMPRLARLDAPGVLHPLIIRGIERRKIFLNDKDREDFLDRLGKLLPEISLLESRERTDLKICPYRAR